MKNKTNKNEYVRFTNSEPDSGPVMARPMDYENGIDHHIPIRWKKVAQGFVLETLLEPGGWIEVPVLL